MKTKIDIVSRLNALVKNVDWVNHILGYDNAGYYIWIIISAMRGPDDYNSTLKERTTYRIRKAVFPKFFTGIDTVELPDKPRKNESEYEFYDRIEDLIIKELDYNKKHTYSSHFLGHYAQACWVYWTQIHKEEPSKTNTKASRASSKKTRVRV